LNSIEILIIKSSVSVSCKRKLILKGIVHPQMKIDPSLRPALPSYCCYACQAFTAGTSITVCMHWCQTFPMRYLVIFGEHVKYLSEQEKRDCSIPFEGSSTYPRYIHDIICNRLEN